MKALDRRNFLKTSALGAAGMAVAKNVKASDSVPDSEESSVIKRQLGNTGILIPVVSMGCGRVDSPVVLKGAMKLGINHFDTAYVYRQGNSELFLGENLKEYPRESFTIATKLKTESTKEEFFKKLDISLERLQMDYVDILYLHGLDDRKGVMNAVMLEALKEAKKLGKAKHVGLSTHRNEPEVIRAAAETGTYEVILTAINFKQDHIADLKSAIAEAAGRGIGIVGMKVMAGGFLDKEKTKPVSYNAALKWVLADENVHTTIPSMVNLEQLQDNARVLKDLTLSPQDEADLAQAAGEQGLYCNACDHCAGTCEKDLPVPELMRAYMYAYGYRETRKAKELLERLGVQENPCADCKVCTVTCVKKFKVSEKLPELVPLTYTPDDLLA